VIVLKPQSGIFPNVRRDVSYEKCQFVVCEITVQEPWDEVQDKSRRYKSSNIFLCFSYDMLQCISL